MTDKPLLVLVSCARDDRDLTEPITRRLRSAQSEGSFKVEILEPGDGLDMALVKGIAGGALFFVFWSRRALRANRVQRECEAAIQHGMRVIPVLLDETPLPEALAKRTTIDSREARKDFLTRQRVKPEWDHPPLFIFVPVAIFAAVLGIFTYKLVEAGVFQPVFLAPLLAGLTFIVLTTVLTLKMRAGNRSKMQSRVAERMLEHTRAEVHAEDAAGN